jgi:large subunit ribosomal protein L31
MRTKIHPEWYAEATVTCACGNTWVTGATVPAIRTEICSNCHPFFTGEQRIVDTEGRVDKFFKRLQRRDSLREETQSSQAQNSPSVSSNLAVAELGLNKRFENLLQENGMTTVGDILQVLTEQGDDGILGISGIGQQALINIKKSIRQLDIEIPVAE